MAFAAVSMMDAKLVASISQYEDMDSRHESLEEGMNEIRDYMIRNGGRETA